MKRRAFMAAAAVLGLGPTNWPSLEGVDENNGARMASVESGEPIYGSVTVPETNSWETDISVYGYHMDDEPSDVEVQASVNGVSVVLNFSPERAREFADELQVAAREAEGGEQ